jgi:hypothetical protein
MQRRQNIGEEKAQTAPKNHCKAIQVCANLQQTVSKMGIKL